MLIIWSKIRVIICDILNPIDKMLEVAVGIWTWALTKTVRQNWLCSHFAGPYQWLITFKAVIITHVCNKCVAMIYEYILFYSRSFVCGICVMMTNIYMYYVHGRELFYYPEMFIQGLLFQLHIFNNHYKRDFTIWIAGQIDT